LKYIPDLDDAHRARLYAVAAPDAGRIIRVLVNLKIHGARTIAGIASRANIRIDLELQETDFVEQPQKRANRTKPPAERPLYHQEGDQE